MLNTRGWIKKKPAAPPSKHVIPLRIRYTPDNNAFRNSSVIAAQLRVLAINTDGIETSIGSFDSELQDRGMRFRFTSDMKRNEFKGRIQNYLSAIVTRRLTYSI